MLSAALELADEPPAAQPSILVLPLSSLSRGSSPALPDNEQQWRQQQQAVSPTGQLLPPRPRRLRQGQQPLAIECRDVPLTCVLATGSQELLVAGAQLLGGLYGVLAGSSVTMTEAALASDAGPPRRSQQRASFVAPPGRTHSRFTT